MTADRAQAVLDATAGSLVLRLPFRPFSSVHTEVGALFSHCMVAVCISWLLMVPCVLQMRKQAAADAVSS